MPERRAVFARFGLLGRPLRQSPPALLSTLYLGLILLGTIGLKVPGASVGPLSWYDAFFTATSAVTVTGLVVVDTGSHFTHFGQAVILVLIQLGGLGLMTFAVLVFSTLGLPVGLSHQVVLREDLNRTSLHDLLHFTGMILRVVAVCEGLGTAAFAFVFVPELGWSEGLWQALFHSVSAFNNAGFALYPDSLSRWATDWIVNITAPLLLMVGGIGFAVIADIWELRSWRRYSLHTKLMLAGTAALIVWSVATFAWLEWNNPATLGAYGSTTDRLMVSWFQAMTTRTAGFNTIDLSKIHDATALLMIALMLIGAGSTSTAGGIKVTTIIVLLLATVAFFKRHDRLRAFGRSLPLDQVLKVMALVTISMLFLSFGLFFLTTNHDGDFLDLSFEVASAFGTVGLTRGATAELSDVGRATIMIIMFAGRVGPLTLGFFMATRTPPRIRYPAGQVFLG